jgi:hypothetical protein
VTITTSVQEHLKFSYLAYMTVEAKKIKKAHSKAPLRRKTNRPRKSMVEFFGRLKDLEDGLTLQKRLRDEWK